MRPASELVAMIGRPLPAAGSAVAVGAVVGMAAARAPEATWGLVAGPLVAAALLALLFRRVVLHPARAALVPVVAAGVIMRALLALVHIVVGLWVYGGAIDFMGYIEQADFYSGDPIVRIVAAMILVVGPNVVGLFSVCVAIGTISAYLFVRAFETAFPQAVGQSFPRLTFCLLPAIGFWSIFLGKDVWIFFVLALATYCVAHLMLALSVRHVLGLGAGIVLAFVIRGPVAAGFCVAVVVAIVTRRLRWEGWMAYLRPIQRLVVLGALGVGVAGLASAALVEYGIEALTVEALAERAYMQHKGFALTDAGSQLPTALHSGDPRAVLAYLPLALFTLFFRPLPWEAHNALAMFAAVENVAFLGLILARLPHLARSVVTAPRHPFMLFALAALVAVSVPVAFQWNLGTMARMRTMALPFLVFLLAGPPPGARPER